MTDGLENSMRIHTREFLRLSRAIRAGIIEIAGGLIVGSETSGPGRDAVPGLRIEVHSPRGPPAMLIGYWARPRCG